MLIDAEKSFAPKVMAAWRVAAAKESYLRRNRVRRFFIFIFFAIFRALFYAAILRGITFEILSAHSFIWIH